MFVVVFICIQFVIFLWTLEINIKDKDLGPASYISTSMKEENLYVIREGGFMESMCFVYESVVYVVVLLF